MPQALTDHVVHFLSDGLRTGAPAVVIATDEHRRAFSSKLAFAGLDTSQLMLLDARETLAGFMLDGLPDPDRFESTVGRLFGSLAAEKTNGHRLRAYGEMVDVLWREGQREAAIRVEELWNDLGRRHSFSLLCTYAIPTAGPIELALLQQHAEEAALAADVASAFVRGGPLDETLAACCESVVRHLDAACARVWMADSGGNLQLRASAGIDPSEATIESYARYRLVVEKRMLGSFAVFAERALTETSLRCLAGIADILAVGIERKRCELLAIEAARRNAQLQAVTATLAKAMTTEEVAEAIVHTGSVELGASAGVIYLTTKEGAIELAAHRGWTAPVEHLQRMSLDTPLPLMDAIKSGAPIWIEDRDTLLARYPIARNVDMAASQLQAVVALPLQLHDNMLGACAFSFAGARTFDAPQREMLESMMQQGAQALARARSYQAERRARAERERLVVELSKIVRLNELFTGVLAHDLRNPLSAIITAAEIARSHPDIGKPLARVISSGERMARMIDQLLDLTRLRVGTGIELERRPTQLVEICRQVVNELEASHPNCKMSVRVEGDTRGEWDIDRLMQVFSNLVANAAQHGTGEARVDVDGTSPSEVIVAVHNDGSIRADVLPRLFDPFRTARSPREGSKSRGLGLGLFITRELVHAHRGSVEVTSDAANGTTFLVRLPRG